MVIARDQTIDPRNIFFWRAQPEEGDDSYLPPKSRTLWRLSNGCESAVDMESLTLKEWSKITKWNFENEYADDNNVSYNTLKWNDESIVRWKCGIGKHCWEESVKSRTSKIMNGDLSLCLECERIRTEWQSKNESEKNQWLEERISQLDWFSNTISNGEYWLKKQLMPKELEYYFIYPNGKSGDIDYYIASHYGMLKQVDELHYVCTFQSDQFDKAFLLTGYQHDEYVSAHNKRFTSILTQHSIIAKWPWDVYSTLRLTNNSRNPRVVSSLNVFSEATDKIRAIRNEIYSKVIEDGSSSGRWVSEQQLYALMKSLFPDAIYQYRCNWLGAQSLDIFIPSISVGVEYQGQQHYCVVDIFGGEDAFEYRVELDKKKQKLCKENGVTLVEWKYTIPITKENVMEIMKKWIK